MKCMGTATCGDMIRDQKTREAPPLPETPAGSRQEKGGKGKEDNNKRSEFNSLVA